MKTENLNNQEVIQLLNFVAYKSQYEMDEIMNNYERLISFLEESQKPKEIEYPQQPSTYETIYTSMSCVSGVLNYEPSTFSGTFNGACEVHSPTIKEKIDSCLETKKINDPLAKLYVRELAIKDNVNSILEKKLEKVFDEIDKEIGFTKEDYPVDPPNNRDLEFAYDEKLMSKTVNGYADQEDDKKEENERFECYATSVNKLIKMLADMEAKNIKVVPEPKYQETPAIDISSAESQLLKYFGKNTPKEESFWKIKKEESPKEQPEKEIDHAEKEVKSLKDMINAFKKKLNLIENVVTPKYD